MKEQASRGIKAYLFRGVFWLLLLLAACVVPFVLGQRVIIERSTPDRPIAQTRPGTASKGGCGHAWRIVASPNSSTNSNILYGVDRRPNGSFWAVGTYYDDTFTAKTLIEYWDGSAWTVQASLNPGSTGNQLNAVATGNGNAWAVGFYTDDNFIAHTLIEQWDGFSWHAVPSPDQGVNGSYLQSVTAANGVWAVGYYIDDNQVNQTLVEQWDGQSWRIVSSPNRGSDGSQLYGIAAVSPADIWAVGYSGQGNGVVTLIEHWNGSAWSIVESPNPGTSGNYLQAACVAYDDSKVWAVGYYYQSGHPRTLIERWDGSNWTVVASPNVGTMGNSLFGVSAYFANDVSAVGAYNLNNQTGTLQTLIEHWDGSTWTAVSSPDEGTLDNILYAIAHYGPDAHSVGTFSDGINGRTLIVYYSDPCATPTPTPDQSPGTPTPFPTSTPTPTSTPRMTPRPRVAPTPRSRPTQAPRPTL